MATDSVSGYTPASNSTQNSKDQKSKTVTSNSDLSKNQFLKILASQLSNQDPMNPMSDTDFIAQMAQFSSLEQMQNLNTTFSSYQAYSLIGKNVLANITADDGSQQKIYGQVSGVIHQDDTDYLQIGSYSVPLSSVVTVDNDTAIGDAITQAATLIGKTIKADIPKTDGSGGTTSVSGKVESISVKNGLLYAKVADTDVPVVYINSVS